MKKQTVIQKINEKCDNISLIEAGTAAGSAAGQVAKGAAKGY